MIPRSNNLVGGGMNVSPMNPFPLQINKTEGDSIYCQYYHHIAYRWRGFHGIETRIMVFQISTCFTQFEDLTWLRNYVRGTLSRTEDD